MRLVGVILVGVLLQALIPSQARTTEALSGCQSRSGYFLACIRHSDADPTTSAFDASHWVAYGRAAAQPHASLLLFLPGTGGRPRQGLPLFLSRAVERGYRVISLAYPNSPAVLSYCANRPDDGCAADFRRMRTFGGIRLNTAFDNADADSIAQRLTMLLHQLHRQDPAGGWDGFVRQGSPDWRRITVSGQSQGAGMAAFIAKQTEVARVILFSGPWDFRHNGEAVRFAPWLRAPAATPPERWFANYHRQEKAAALLARSYVLLGVPEIHVRVQTAGGDRIPSEQGNPFHGYGVASPDNQAAWDFFLEHGEAQP